MKAKAKPKHKAPETPDEPKAEEHPPDPVTAKAVEASLKRKSTVDGESSGRKEKKKKVDSPKVTEPAKDDTNENDDSSSSESEDDEAALAAKAETVRIKREAHARFMRFSRSLKSS